MKNIIKTSYKSIDKSPKLDDNIYNSYENESKNSKPGNVYMCVLSSRIQYFSIQNCMNTGSNASVKKNSSHNNENNIDDDDSSSSQSTSESDSYEFTPMNSDEKTFYNANNDAKKDDIKVNSNTNCLPRVYLLDKHKYHASSIIHIKTKPKTIATYKDDIKDGKCLTWYSQIELSKAYNILNKYNYNIMCSTSHLVCYPINSNTLRIIDRFYHKSMVEYHKHHELLVHKIRENKYDTRFPGPYKCVINDRHYRHSLVIPYKDAERIIDMDGSILVNNLIAVLYSKGNVVLYSIDVPNKVSDVLNVIHAISIDCCQNSFKSGIKFHNTAKNIFMVNDWNIIKFIKFELDYSYFAMISQIDCSTEIFRSIVIDEYIFQNAGIISMNFNINSTMLGVLHGPLNKSFGMNFKNFTIKIQEVYNALTSVNYITFYDTSNHNISEYITLKYSWLDDAIKTMNNYSIKGVLIFQFIIFINQIQFITASKVINEYYSILNVWMFGDNDNIVLLQSININTPDINTIFTQLIFNKYSNSHLIGVLNTFNSNSINTNSNYKDCININKQYGYNFTIIFEFKHKYLSNINKSIPHIYKANIQHYHEPIIQQNICKNFVNQLNNVYKNDAKSIIQDNVSLYSFGINHIKYMELQIPNTN